MAVRNRTKHGKPKYQFFPDLPPEEYESLKADVAVHGIQYAVIQDEKGNTLDGHPGLDRGPSSTLLIWCDQSVAC